MLNKESLNNLAGDIWKGAIKLRGKFKPKDYAAAILPMIVIRRIECVLETKREELARQLVRVATQQQFPNLTADALQTELGTRFTYYSRHEIDLTDLNITSDILRERVKLIEKNTINYHNTTYWTIHKILLVSRLQAEQNFRDYVNGFAPVVRQIIDKFDFRATIGKMVTANRLESIMDLVKNLDLSPARLSNLEMGYVYEELLQRFSQDDAKDTGEHFTPREVIRLMVSLLDIDLEAILNNRAISIYDPACGTGGMLSVAKEHLIDSVKTPDEATRLKSLVMLFGQELLPMNYAVCLADMLIKDEHLDVDDRNQRQPVNQITNGNSLIAEDGLSRELGDFHQHQRFDYMLSNPPFGVDWGEYKKDVEGLRKTRYKAGLPPTNDGALLFLLSMVEKMKLVTPSPVLGGPPLREGRGEVTGSRIAILFNGSPLSNGDALSGESEIRRQLLQADLVEAIVMLPDQLFYSTGIYTYIWVLTNNKPDGREGKVLIVNARDQFEKEPKSFGNKRHRITDAQRATILDRYHRYEDSETTKLFRTSDFAFHKVEVTYWLHDEDGEPMYQTEPFDVQLNNTNVKRKFDLYGDLDFSVVLTPPSPETGEGTGRSDVSVRYTVSFVYTGDDGFDTLLARALLAQQPDAVDGKSVKDLKNYLKVATLEATYTHRHYVVDNEYIPYDPAATDRGGYIEGFLAREIDYPIVRWQEAEQLGYEILPNKYFYRYEEPTPSDQLIDEFWQLEEQAEAILKQIRTPEPV